MINSEGKRVREINAAQAAHNCRINPSNPEMLTRANILTGIERNSKLGEMAYTHWTYSIELTPETVDWLVDLGYRVHHNVGRNHVGLVQHTYTIYWVYPVGNIEEFSPGVTHT